MGFPIELLRAHTIPGLHEIQIANSMTLKAWIVNSRYKISTQKTKKEFVLDVYAGHEILSAYAYDINRMASSSFESLVGISKEKYFPKSIGWLIIRLYYSAHTILRFFGISCSQLDQSQAKAIDVVAYTYGYKTETNNTSSAYYLCRYYNKTNMLHGEQLNNTHADVWVTFYKLLNDLENKIVTSDFLKRDRDEAILFIFRLRDRLSNNRNTSGNWLSQVRNDVNYAHAMGAWFPYSGSPGVHEDMFRQVTSWSPLKSALVLGEMPKTDELVFLEACLAVISLAKELILDIGNINNKTFLTNGAMKCLNVCNQKH